jgi:hypothetical protein
MTDAKGLEISAYAHSALLKEEQYRRMLLRMWVDI